MSVALRIVPRSESGARYGRGADASNRLPWDEAVIHTEAGAVPARDWAAIEANLSLYDALNASFTETEKFLAVERYHAVNLGWNGIGYSFFITYDGTIFEGRGWGRQGSHTETRNSTAVGICFQGHGDIRPATKAQWRSAKWLIREGIRLGHLRSNPKVTGHRNYSQKGKSCPGNLIYPHLGQLRGITRTTVIDTTGAEVPPTPKETFLMSLTKAQQEQILKDSGDGKNLAMMAYNEARHARADAAAARLLGFQQQARMAKLMAQFDLHDDATTDISAQLAKIDADLAKALAAAKS